MSTPGRPVPHGQMRPADADRDKVAEQLGEAFATGRLDDEEYSERLQKALEAKSFNDLEHLLLDIPGSQPSRPGPGRFPVPANEAGVPVRRSDNRPVASAALGVAGFVGLGPLAWIPALVLGHAALKDLPRNDDRRSLAVIGLALSWSGAALSAIFIVLMVVFAFASGGG